MKLRLPLFLSCALIFIAQSPLFAQVSGDNVFLKGRYVQIGINAAGAYGSNVSQPAGYYGNVSQFLYDPGTGGYPTGGDQLGFIADVARDGFTVGSPAFIGDYFLPGSPQEGWGIEIDGNEADGYTTNFESFGSNGFSSSTAGTLAMTVTAPAAYYTLGSKVNGVWQGTTEGGDIHIQQTTVLDTNQLFFVMRVKIWNTSASTTYNNIYYMRTLDPDNDETDPGGSFTTINTVEYTLPNPSNKTLVSAVGLSPTAPYLGLGSEDCRAVPFIVTSGLIPADDIQTLWGGSAGSALYSGTQTQDEGIGLAFNLGNLAAGDTTSLAYAYVLSADELDSAFAETAPTVSEGGSSHTAVDSVHSCAFSSGYDTVRIVDGGDFVWSWSPGTGLSDTTGTVVVIKLDSITSETIYTVVGTSGVPGLCAVKTFTIVVPPPFEATPVDSPVFYCQGIMPAPLTAHLTDPAAHLMWYTSATGGTGSTTAPVPSTGVPGVTTYYVTQVSGVCESERVPLVVTVSPMPIIVASNNSPICEYKPLMFTATDSVPGGSPGGVGTFAWNGPGSFSSTLQNPVIGAATTGAAGTYTVTLSVPGCPPVSTTTTTVVHPGVEITTDTTIDPTSCSHPNGSITLGTVSAGTYTITYVDNDTLFDTVSVSADSHGNLVIDSLRPGLYNNIVVTATDGCQSDPVGPLRLNGPYTNPPYANDTDLCQNSVAGPLHAFGDSLLWYTDAHSDPGSTFAITPSTTSVGTEVYYVSQTMNGCESPRRPVDVTILAQPASPVPTSNSPICAGTLLDLSPATSDPGMLYTWTGPEGFYATIEDITTVAYSEASGVYSLTVTDANGCTSKPGLATITVHPIPPPPASGTFVYCQRDAEVLVPVVGEDLKWYSVPNGGVGDTTWPVVSTVSADSITYYVSQSIFGCESPRIAATVVVNYSPIAHISASKTSSCVSDTLSLVNDGYTVPGEEYAWSVPSAAVIESGSLTSAGPIVPQFDTDGIYPIVLATSNAMGGCTTIDTVDINVVALPVTELKITPHDACPGEQVTVALSYINKTATSFVWDFGGGSALSRSDNSGGPYEVTWPDAGSHTVRVTAYNALNCPNVSDALDTVFIHTNPDARIAQVSSNNVCSGDSVFFSAGLYNETNKYEWSPGHYFNNTNGDSIYGRVELTGYVMLTVTNAYGCSATDSTFITANPCCTVSFPNAFSPNGDGRNDLFRPITMGNHRLHQFSIQNRWGQTVYSTSQEHDGWDGLYNGVPQDIGVYFYIIKYDCDGKTVEAHGDFTLIR